MKEFQKTLGLSLTLARANMKIKNENSFSGFLWYLLDPIVIFAIFMLIRKNIAHDVPHYALYLIIGLVMFNFFRKATNQALTTIQSKQAYIQSMNINADVFVFSSIISIVMSHLFEILLLVIFVLIFHISLITLIGYLAIFLCLLIFTIGLSFLVATIGVYVRDFQNIWSVFTRLLWFLTPIFYISSTSTLLTQINLFNPLYYFIETARSIIIPNYVTYSHMFTISILWALVSLLIGYSTFRAHKKYLPEIV